MEKIIFELAVKDANVATQLDAMRESMRQINAELKTTDKNSEAYVRLRKEGLETQYLIDELTKSQRNLRKEFAATQLPTDSLAGMRIEYGKLVQSITNMSKAQRESEGGQAAIKQADSLKKSINEVEQSYGNFTGSVGNYKASIIEAFGVLEGMGGTLGDKAQLLTGAKAAFEAASAGAERFGSFVSGMADSLRNGLSDLRGYVDGLKNARNAQADAEKNADGLAEAVGDIGGSAAEGGRGLAQSAQGATLFARAGTALRTVLSSLGIGLVIAAVTGLIGVFQKFAPVVDFVEQLVAGLGAAFDVFIGRAAQAAQAVSLFFQGDFSGAFEQGKSAVTGLGDAMVEAGIAAAGLKKELQDLEDAQKDFALESAKNDLQVKKLELALKDSTKSAKERIAISNEITKLEGENLKSKQSLIDQQIDIERRRLVATGQLTEEESKQVAAGNIQLARDLGDKYKIQNEAWYPIQKLLIQRVNAETESVATTERANNRKNALIQQQAEKDKAAEEKATALREKVKKEAEAQTKRILDLEKQIRESDATTILNEFDKKVTEIENKRLDALNKIAEQRAEIEKKSALSSADNTELERLSELKASVIAATKEEIKAVEELRKEAQDKQLQDLRALKSEINALIVQNAQGMVEAEVEEQKELARVAAAALKQREEQERRALEESFIEGKISREKYEKRGQAISQKYNALTLDAEKALAAQRIELAKTLAAAQIESARIASERQIQEINASTDSAVKALQELQTTSGIDQSDNIKAAQEKAAKEREAAQQAYQKAVTDAQKGITDAQIEGAEAVNDKDAQVHADKMKRIAEEKAARKELQDFLIGTASTVSGAVAAIERNRIDREKDQRLTALDEEFEVKKDKAQGNAALIAKLEAEQEKKRKAIELEAARERKRLAIIEATIAGALAVVKALPNPFAAAAAAIAAAAQIAVISSQKFAMGGAVKFGKQGVFGGKYHSAGGTKGYFDDGTVVEVEKDELFTILNRKATRAIQGLSDFNAAHGGNRFFAGGGVLDFTPQLGIPGASGSAQQVVVVQSGFTDEQVEVMADRIAEKNAVRTSQAVANGIYDANRLNERQVEMNEKRAI